MEWQNILKEIRQKKPVVHCITNIVTVNDCANILHAIGAAPVMAHHPMEVSEVTEKSSALVCNMGALENFEAMIVAGKRAGELGHPIVIDPVGVAASEYRRNRCMELIENIRPNCIRGNISEINALVYGKSDRPGVDAQPSDVPDFIKINERAKEWNTIIVVSGESDYICDGEAVHEINGGSNMYRKITGAGCMSSVVMGAFLAVSAEKTGCAEACDMMKKAGEEAEKRMKIKTGGSMTFRHELIDYLSLC